MVAIYILQCEDDKYYVGKSENVKKRLKQHYNGNGSLWTSKYKPVKVLQIIQNCVDEDEDKYTKIMMRKYGIDNVRGGAYCQLELDEITKIFLEKELCNSSDICYRCKRSGHFASKCYAKTMADGKIIDQEEISENNTDINETKKTVDNTFVNLTEEKIKEISEYINARWKEILRETPDNRKEAIELINKRWKEDCGIPRPMDPEFLNGTSAVWNDESKVYTFYHNGKTYCYPKYYSVSELRRLKDIRTQWNIHVLEYQNFHAFIRSRSTSNHFSGLLNPILYVIELDNIETKKDDNNTEIDLKSLINEGISAITNLFSSITIHKVVAMDDGNTKLEMSALAITKIRESEKNKICLDGNLYNILSTKRDLGLFAGSKNNYIVIEGKHNIVPKSYELFMQN